MIATNHFDRAELLEMLTYRRPWASATCDEFVARYIASLPDAICDTFGNYHVLVGTSSVLWSCHTDTVHRFPGRQTVRLRGDMVTLSRRAKRGLHRSNCLGADDTIGVFLLRAMILAGVPGWYIFHDGEECGGLGSSALAQYAPDAFENVKYAIALDRRGTSDVITHQCGIRTASDEFAWSVARQLTDVADYAPCARGIYTDTAEYADLIPECTNISVGYQYEHMSRESVDLAHVERLLTALLAFDETKLTESRTLRSYDDTLAYMLWCEYCEQESQMDAGDDPDDMDACWCRHCGCQALPPSMYLSDDYHDVQRALMLAELEREH